MIRIPWIEASPFFDAQAATSPRQSLSSHVEVASDTVPKLRMASASFIHHTQGDGIMRRRRIGILLTLALGAVVVATSQPAEAATATCNATSVAWYPGAGGTLQLLCSGTWYYGLGTSASCPIADIDSRKAWLSIAESSLLGGKTVTIDYTTCTGGPGLTNVRLNQ